FKANPAIIARFELEFRRDEQILRYLTVAEDKHHTQYAERRRKGEVGNMSKMTGKEGRIQTPTA
ncbi:MAG: 30S ribosomal protein S6, partial [Bacteroidetes bacterium]|nr:30S ribosomal protein S6 [Bacteroidota bacterium]